MPLRDLGVDAEERLAELVDDAGSAQLRERIVRGSSRDDWAIGQRLSGTVMVGDDHVEAARGSLRDLCCGGDPTVDGQDQAAPLVGEPRERATAYAVAFVEAARQVPIDVGAELAKEQNRERCCRDAVDVVVAVDADPRPGGDGGANAFARGRHVAEQEGVVRRLLTGEEAARVIGVEITPPREDGGRDGGNAERAREVRLSAGRAVGECPRAVVHRPATLRRGADGIGLSKPVFRPRCAIGAKLRPPRHSWCATLQSFPFGWVGVGDGVKGVLA